MLLLTSVSDFGSPRIWYLSKIVFLMEKRIKSDSVQRKEMVNEGKNL